MIKLQTGHFEPFFLYYDNVFSPQVFWIVTSQLKFGVEEPVRKLTVMTTMNSSVTYRHNSKRIPCSDRPVPSNRDGPNPVAEADRGLGRGSLSFNVIGSGPGSLAFALVSTRSLSVSTDFTSDPNALNDRKELNDPNIQTQ